MEAYQTLRALGMGEFTEKKSRFLGYAQPVETEEQAQSFLTQIRKEHWNARHAISAYRLRGGLQHCSDDGEPQGTGGVPTLNVLVKNELCDAMVVVVRYFGGVLLGTGGLTRAYSHAATLAVQQAGKLEMIPGVHMSLVCSYSQYGKLVPLIQEYDGVVDHSEFTETVKLLFHLEQNLQDRFCAELTNATLGAVFAQVEGESYFSR